MLNPNSRKKQNNNRSYQNQSRQNTNAGGTSTKSSSHQKVFADDEGEYVDYEEVNYLLFLKNVFSKSAASSAIMPETTSVRG